MLLRYARENDRDAICRVWTGAFGDSEDFILAFFNKTEILPHTVVAELGGRVRSFMCAFDNISGMSYLYALCTAPEYRGLGIGGKVLREAIRLAYERGAGCVGLHPASASLAKWYEDNFNLKPSGYFIEESYTPSKTNFKAEEVPFHSLLDADDSLTPSLCAAQNVLADFYGGKLLKIDSCLVYSEMRDGHLTIKSIVGADAHSEYEEKIISAAANYFGASSVTLRRCAAQINDIENSSLKCYVNLLLHDADNLPFSSARNFKYSLD